MATTTPSVTAVADRLLRAGALLPPAAAHGRDLPTDTLAARTYRHPVLAEPVVQLTPTATAAGDDLVMGFLGFADPAVGPAVAQTVRRAPGFPAWALINDPKHARHALDVVKAMKSAGRRVRSKPGHAWEAFDAIAKQLGRSTAHFLPSYWEEVGRAFIEAGNATYASRSFSKAREAEQVHALKVDLEAQRAAILEFALRGAVSIKALEEFARSCVKRDGAKAAWAGFRDLCLKRCQGGMPPWGNMLGELLAMAKAAGAARDAELLRLVAELLPLPAVRQAPEAFWDAAKPAIDRLAADPAWAGRLLDLVPSPGGDSSWYGTWATWLEGWGLIDHLVAGHLPDGTALAVAPWFERLAERCTAMWSETPAVVYRLAERLAPRLCADGVAVQLASDGSADLDLVELALGLGLRLADPPEDLRVPINAWVGPHGAEAHPQQGRDPARTAADPRFRPALRRALANALDEGDKVKALVAAPSLLALAREVVEERIAESARGGLPGVVDAAQWLGSNLLPPLRTAAPELVAHAIAIPVAACLARTLRCGLIDELGWPALEAAVARLRRAPDPNVEDDTGLPVITGQAPFAVVHNGVRAEVVGPDGTVLACDLSRPAGAETTAVLYRDGRILHAWSVGWQEHGFSWSHEPNVHHPLKDRLRGGFEGAQIELPGGGTCTGRRAWRAGEAQLPVESREVVGDGRTIWVRQESELRELDPATGDLGRASMPAFFEAWAERQLDLARCSLLPVPAGSGPVIRLGGLAGVRVARSGDGGACVEALDGSTWQGRAGHPAALLRWPGDEGGPPRLLDRSWRATEVRSPEGWISCHSDPSWSPGQPCQLPAEFWLAMQVRDAAASAALRRWSDADAAALIATAAGELPEPVEGEDEDEDAEGEETELVETTAHAARLLPGGADDRLRDAVATVGGIAALVARKLTALAGDGPEIVDASVEELVANGCGQLGWGIAAAKQRPVAAMHRFAALLRAGPVDGRITTQLKDWNQLGRLDLVGFTIALAGQLPSRYQRVEGDPRAALAAWCEALAGSGLCELPGRWRFGSCAFDKAKPPVPVAKVSYSSLDGGAWADGSAYLLWGSTYGDEAELLEYAPDGVFRGLAAAPFTAEQEVHLPPPARLAAWAAALRRDRPAPPAPELIDRAAALIGCERGIAALLVAGLPGYNSYEHNFLPKELREALGLKVAEAATARDQLRSLDEARLRTLVAALVGDDPAGLWQLDAPGADGLSPLQRLAAAWMGSRQDALPTTVRVKPPAELVEACAAVRDGKPAFTAGPAAITLSKTSYDTTDLSFDVSKGRALDRELLEAAMMAAREVHLHQPWDSPSAQAIAALIPHIDRVLDDPATVMEVDGVYLFEAQAKQRFQRTWESLAGARSETLSGDGLTGELRDDGQMVIARSGDEVLVGMRTHQVRSAADAARFIALRGPDLEQEADLAQLVVAWRSPPVRALFARLGAAGLPPGAYDGDPRHCAPQLVTAAAKRLKLGEDGAIAYLMVLALAEPTDALLRSVLSWDADRLAAALDEAVGRKLLVAAKRRGAGRSRFLPGGWEDLKGSYLPVETWKLPLYGGQRRKAALILPPGPLLPTMRLSDLYAAAWQRVVDGDAPRYEEVR